MKAERPGKAPTAKKEFEFFSGRAGCPPDPPFQIALWAAGFLEVRAIQTLFWKAIIKNQKTIHLGILRQRASQTNHFPKVLNLGTPWSPESYIPSLRTWVDPGLGVPSLKLFRKFQNWEGVDKYEASSEFGPTPFGPKSKSLIFRIRNSTFESVTFDDTRIFNTVMTWSTF